MWTEDELDRIGRAGELRVATSTTLRVSPRKAL